MKEVLVTKPQQGNTFSPRTGRLYRNDLVETERLRAETAVTNNERVMIDRLIEERRVGALYFSLLAGEAQKVRSLLKHVALHQIGRRRHLALRFTASLPFRLLRRLGHARLAELVTI